MPETLPRRQDGAPTPAAVPVTGPTTADLYAPLKAKRLARLAQFANPNRINTPVIHPAPPTITESTAATITTSFKDYRATDSALTPISSGPPVLNTSTFYSSNPVNAPSATDSHVGFVLIGDTFEYRWRAPSTATTPGPQMEILVDGLPIVADGIRETTLSTSGGTQCYLKAVFPDSRPREVRIYHRVGQTMGVRVPVGQAIAPCARRPWTIGWITDSYGEENVAAGTPSGFQLFPRRVSRALGAEFLQSTQPGSGFTVGGTSAATFADSRRVNALAAAGADLIVVAGGTNDWNAGSPNYAAVASAVTSLLTQLAAALPGVPVIVAGPQALLYTQTLSAAYATLNKTVRDAALAQPNCLAHVDMIGNAATGILPAAYANGAAYSVGAQMTYQGAIYQCTSPIASGPGTPDWNYWDLRSWLTGTGKLGGTTGDGNRDTMLYTDSTHPTLAGQDNLTARLTAAILGAIKIGAASA